MNADKYMSLVAKCTGAKRVNFTKRNSYTARAYAAAISHSRGPGWHVEASWKNNFSTGPTTSKCLGTLYSVLEADNQGHLCPMGFLLQASKLFYKHHQLYKTIEGGGDNGISSANLSQNGF
ncbi:unnamed protein product [Acanthoscelides obtectus]|uniref:Uncharacterized protein n=1 Tax=Acanthoscelides obtectus TaxID=200917 RepID=A0A9P0KM36_ACAOB|nr:unnamed protein product [Acanthoscelides obtectus]CAK1648216.1 hypothetical protein AOBTE_LOCUS15608 [Acanthoscelides obtectus]